MLAIIRIILVLIISIGICIFGIFYCLIKPFQPCYASIFSRMFGRMAPIFGVRMEIRNFSYNRLPKHCIYISNHQNSYDMITLAYVLPPRTITVGKKSLLWIPLFGQLFWLSGNILINRSKSIRSHSILTKVVKKMKLYDFSVWIFPEGTRSYEKGLLPFKTGAFYAAIFSKVPIIPVCVSSLSNNKIKLNRKYNGLVIIEMMRPIETDQCNITQVRWMTKHCYDIMKVKFDELNREVAIRENKMSRLLNKVT